MSLDRFYPSNLQVEVRHPLLSFVIDSILTICRLKVRHPLLLFLCPKVRRSLLFIQLLTISRSSDNHSLSRMVRYDPSVLRYVTHYCSSSCLQSVVQVTIVVKDVKVHFVLRYVTLCISFAQLLTMPILEWQLSSRRYSNVCYLLLSFVRSEWSECSSSYGSACI